ncbi:MAG: hypothetical protein AAGG48_25360 [Planctomycetota bacterium]
MLDRNWYRWVAAGFLFGALTCCVAVFNLQFYGFGATGFSGLMVLSVPLFLFVGAGLFLIKHPAGAATSWLVAIAITAGTYSSIRINSAKVEASIDGAGRIVVAINRYIEQHDTSPATLNDLEPRFLPTIPSTSMRLWDHPPYTYRSNGRTYRLLFDSPAFMVTEFNSETQRWLTHD